VNSKSCKTYSELVDELTAWLFPIADFDKFLAKARHLNTDEAALVRLELMRRGVLKLFTDPDGVVRVAVRDNFTEPLQAQPEPDEVQASANAFKPFTDADRAYLESVL
jgi:hypothetical protein